jgi:hypothetical protein
MGRRRKEAVVYGCSRLVGLGDVVMRLCHEVLLLAEP